MHYILFHLFRLFCLFQVQDWQKTKPLNLIQSWEMARKQHACSCAELIAVTSSWTFLKRLGRKCLSQNHRARSLSRTSTQRLLCFCLEIDVHWLSLIWDFHDNFDCNMTWLFALVSIYSTPPEQDTSRSSTLYTPDPPASESPSHHDPERPVLLDLP